MKRRLPRLPDAGCAQASRAGLLLFLSFQLFLTGCAKIGTPHPPAVLVPKPAADLAARQYSDDVLLTVSAPTQNTDGSRVTSLGFVELWRRIEPPTAAAAPLGQELFFEGAEKIMMIPGDQVTGLKHGNSLVLTDGLTLPDRAQIYSRLFRYAVRFLNRKKQNAGLSNQAVIVPVPIPPAPGVLAAEVTQDFIRLKWTAPAENMDGSTPPRIAGYNIYRSENPNSFPPAPLNQGPVLKPEYEDRSFEFDHTYYYSVSVVGSVENPYAESRASPPLQVAPRDTFPPGAPVNLNAVEAGPAVLLLWGPPPQRDVAGYRIYRQADGEPEVRLQEKELVTAMSYRDEKVQPGKKYTYRVTAVDTHSNEGSAAVTELEVR